MNEIVVASISYDSMGRVTQSTQTTGNSSFHFSYAYNRNGDREWVQYPSGRQVATCYDAAARPAQVQNFATQTNYVSGVQYAVHGALSQVNYKNGAVESTSYNTRLQPSSIGVSLGGANALTLGYDYGSAIPSGERRAEQQRQQRVDGDDPAERRVDDLANIPIRPIGSADAGDGEPDVAAGARQPLPC